MKYIILVVITTIYDTAPFSVYVNSIKEAHEHLCGVNSYMIIDAETQEVLENHKFVPIAQLEEQLTLN